MQLPLIQTTQPELSLLQTKWKALLDPLLTTAGVSGATIKSPSLKSAYQISKKDYFLPCNAQGAAFTTILPVGPPTGTPLVIQKQDSTFNAVTIQSGGSAVIGAGGTNTTTLNTQGETLSVLYDGTNWQILSRTYPQLFTAYTPTVTNLGTGSSSTLTGKWLRQGPGIWLQIAFQKDASAGTGASVINFSTPSGISVASANLVNIFGNLFFGTVELFGWTGAATFTTSMANLTSAKVGILKPGTGGGMTGADCLANAEASFAVWMPITGWN